MGKDIFSMDIHDHGVFVRRNASCRVRCNYCERELSSFARLKRHLACVRLGVPPCTEVPGNVKQTFRDAMGTGIASPIPLQIGARSSRVRASLSRAKTPSPVIDHNFLMKKAQSTVGRIFFEYDFDVLDLESPSFTELFNEVYPGVEISSITPKYHDASVWILQEAVRETQEYVNNIKYSWPATGCTLLIDSWTSWNGLELVNFIVDSPRGRVYLKTCNMTKMVDLEEIVAMMKGVINEVGEDNVLQIIIDTPSGWLDQVAKWFQDNGSGFSCNWSLSGSSGFGFMLNMIEELDFVADVQHKARTIWEFVHRDASLLKLFKEHCPQHTCRAQEICSATPYEFLTSTLTARQGLVEMFSSDEWKKMRLASWREGKAIAKLVKDEDGSFWAKALAIYRSIVPFVEASMESIGKDERRVGTMHGVMENLKMTAENELGAVNLDHQPYWDIIDEVSEIYIFSKLHITGYLLNPQAYHLGEVRSPQGDDTDRVLATLLEMVTDKDNRYPLLKDLDAYLDAEDAFDEATAPDNLIGISPEKWWSRYGWENPHLQRIAIKILNQTCEGAGKFRMNKTAGERLFRNGLSLSKFFHVKDMAFVHYNAHLYRWKPSASAFPLLGSPLASASTSHPPPHSAPEPFRGPFPSAASASASTSHAPLYNAAAAYGRAMLLAGAAAASSSRASANAAAAAIYRTLPPSGLPVQTEGSDSS